MKEFDQVFNDDLEIMEAVHKVAQSFGTSVKDTGFYLAVDPSKAAAFMLHHLEQTREEIGRLWQAIERIEGGKTSSQH